MFKLKLISGTQAFRGDKSAVASMPCTTFAITAKACVPEMNLCLDLNLRDFQICFVVWNRPYDAYQHHLQAKSLAPPLFARGEVKTGSLFTNV